MRRYDFSEDNETVKKHGNAKKGIRDDLPVVACRTATFCRPESLNEAVESFLRQDYLGPKKIVILNDCPTMTYECEHPEVEVENCPIRHPTLGDKMNHLVSQIDADIIINWPDDDIMMPWSISTVVDNLSKSEVFWGKGYWYMESGSIKSFITRHCAGVLGYRREVWERVGGYSPIDNGEDQDFFSRIRNLYKVDPIELSPETAYFIYRWATGYGHISGYGEDPDAYAKFGDEAIRRVLPGTYRITPGWRENYVALVRSFLSQKETAD